MGSGPAIHSGVIVPTGDAVAGIEHGRGTSSEPFASVAVHADLAPVEAAWTELERIAPISGYQTLRWMKPWIETVGRANGIVPTIVAAHDRDGRPVAVLPLGVVRTGLIRKAAFLGGRDANLNMGLFRPGARWTPKDVRTLLSRAAEIADPGIDIFDLRNQPLSWSGYANPLASFTRLPSPSFSAFGRLDPEADAFFAARTSAETRKTLRKKARRLVKHLGALRHIVAGDADQARLILDTFQQQKTVRLRKLGLPDLFAETSLMAFLSRAAIERLPNPAIELHALAAGDRIVATFGGTGHAGRFSGMFISFDDEIEVARSSPGDQLLRCVVMSKCDEGVEVFDLGIGEALYKTSYCDEVEPLFDTLVPVTLIGRALGVALAQRVRLKRFAKQTPWAWTLVRSVRKLQSRL